MPMSESSPTERIHLCGHFSHLSEAPPSEDTKHQVMLSLRIVAACDDANSMEVSPFFTGETV